jgi:hypothetical protein
MYVQHTFQGVVTRHAGKATEATHKKFTRLRDDHKPASTRNHKAEKRFLANALLSHILLMYRNPPDTGG